MEATVELDTVLDLLKDLLKDFMDDVYREAETYSVMSTAYTAMHGVHSNAMDLYDSIRKAAK